jgi:hypothetical protein
MLGDELQELKEHTDDELAEMDKDTLKAEIAILEGRSLLDGIDSRKHAERQGRFQCVGGISTSRDRVQRTFQRS